MHEEREANIWSHTKRYIIQSVILLETVYVRSHRATKTREWTGSAMYVCFVAKQWLVKKLKTLLQPSDTQNHAHCSLSGFAVVRLFFRQLFRQFFLEVKTCAKYKIC